MKLEEACKRPYSEGERPRKEIKGGQRELRRQILHTALAHVDHDGCSRLLSFLLSCWPWRDEGVHDQAKAEHGVFFWGGAAGLFTGRCTKSTRCLG